MKRFFNSCFPTAVLRPFDHLTITTTRDHRSPSLKISRCSMRLSSSWPWSCWLLSSATWASMSTSWALPRTGWLRGWAPGRSPVWQPWRSRPSSPARTTTAGAKQTFRHHTSHFDLRGGRSRHWNALPIRGRWRRQDSQTQRLSTYSFWLVGGRVIFTLQLYIQTLF